jgi:hypothetical protein
LSDWKTLISCSNCIRHYFVTFREAAKTKINASKAGNP